MSSGQRVSRSLAEAAGKIRLLVVDVDGVLTDGSIILDNEGNEYKSFHVRDGHGIKMLIRAGIGVAIITGRFSKVVERRARELGITELHQKCRDKRAVYNGIAKKYSLSDAEIAYMGDDIIDAPVMAMAGLPIAVKDADEEVKKYARHVTKNRGGRGAVREVSDLILKSKGLWKRIVDEYFET